eukprot:1195816-Prorocentrum_minimum.AAC.11
MNGRAVGSRARAVRVVASSSAFVLTHTLSRRFGFRETKRTKRPKRRTKGMNTFRVLKPRRRGTDREW